jgi:rRNA maturation endonuclease Nob1
VISFAKKTGDYSVLSLTDLKVIALTLELAEKLPESQIRLEPLPVFCIDKDCDYW